MKRYILTWQNNSRPIKLRRVKYHQIKYVKTNIWIKCSCYKTWAPCVWGWLPLAPNLRKLHLWPRPLLHSQSCPAEGSEDLKDGNRYTDIWSSPYFLSSTNWIMSNSVAGVIDTEYIPVTITDIFVPRTHKGHWFMVAFFQGIFQWDKQTAHLLIAGMFIYHLFLF